MTVCVRRATRYTVEILTGEEHGDAALVGALRGVTQHASHHHVADVQGAPRFVSFRFISFFILFAFCNTFHFIFIGPMNGPTDQ